MLMTSSNLLGSSTAGAQQGRGGHFCRLSRYKGRSHQPPMRNPARGKAKSQEQQRGILFAPYSNQRASRVWTVVVNELLGAYHRDNLHRSTTAHKNGDHPIKVALPGSRAIGRSICCGRCLDHRKMSRAGNDLRFRFLYRTCYQIHPGSSHSRSHRRALHPARATLRRSWFAPYGRPLSRQGSGCSCPLSSADARAGGGRAA